MSAYLVEQNHIAYLVAQSRAHILRGTMDYTVSFMGGGDPEALGQILWDENLKSINYLYKDRQTLPAYKHKNGLYVWDALQVCHSVSCYEYQSCEHPGWEESKAADFCRQLSGVAISTLLGGKIWGAPKPQANVISLSDLMQRTQ